MTDVFLSYSRKDKTFVQRLHNAIAAENRDAWVDWKEIPLTSDWWVEIREGIEAADTFVFVISPDSACSEVCNQELDHAAQLKKRIVPIVYRDTEDVPKKLKHLNWVFCRESDNFDSAFKALVETMDTDLEWVKAHTRLTQRAVEWDKKERKSSYILHGEELTASEKMLTQTDKEPRLTNLQAKYILASRRRVTRRRWVWGIAISASIVILLIGFSYLQYSALQPQLELGYIARIAEQERDQAISRELAANAKLNMQTAPQLSILLAVQAVSTFPTTEAVDALKQVIGASDDIQTEELLEEAKGRLTRSWSLDECKKYLHQDWCPE